LALPCVHRSSTSEFSAPRRPLRHPRRSPPRVVSHRTPASKSTERRRAREFPRRRRPPTSVRRTPRRSSRASSRIARPDVRRASRRSPRAPTLLVLLRASRPRRAAKPRTEARLGAPMRSPRVDVGVRRASMSVGYPAPKSVARRRARELPRRSPPRVVPNANSRADARRAHGSAGASRPTRRPGGLVGARRRARRPPAPGAAPTSPADVARRRRPPTLPRRPPRRSSRDFARRTPTRRQAAHGGAPWRSHADTARQRRSAPQSLRNSAVALTRIRRRRALNCRRWTPRTD
jgi:hypothetical protein